MDTTVLAAFLEYSPNPTWLADSDGRCVYANQEVREITALSAAQLGGLNWLELVVEEDRQMSSTLWQEARLHHQPYRARFLFRAMDSVRGNWAEQIQSGRPGDNQFRILGADGKYHWFLSRAEPLGDSDGQVRYWVGVNIDIDDKKRASEALDAARERIGRATQSAAIAELSASLSDRIVQPLAAVVANARAALNWLSSDNLNISQANAALEGVVRDGMSAGNIVHEMRQLFDRRRPNPRAIDLNTLIEQVISLQAPDVRDKGVAIDCELNPDLPVAFADAAQIQQVLFNLLVDACEAMSRSEEPKKLTAEDRLHRRSR